MGSALVVISHYNAWPVDQLVALLDQIQSIPAGYAFTVRVVVNQAEPKPLELPSRHSEIEVLYRENTGYNIGAWDLGWRQPPKHDYYLFLQEECVIQKKDWLKAFVRVLERPGVGLVGESLASETWKWDEVSRDPKSYWNLTNLPEGKERPVDWTVLARNFLNERGIDPTETMDHLQSLVICLPIGVLEAIKGFHIGGTYLEAMACEVGISKAVQALGLRFEQLSTRPFEYILHPQWEKVRLEAAGMRWWLKTLSKKLVEKPLRSLSHRKTSAVANRI